MITNTGKTILAKYLIGSAPAYASHIALGVGPQPLATADAFGDYAEQDALAFEVLRVPITSRGYVYDEAGAANIVFSAELPGDQRYSFTEIGVYSGKSNPAAGSRDSRMIYTFTESENWEYHDPTTATTVPSVTGELTGEADDIIAPTDAEDNPLVTFLGKSNDTTFSTETRYTEYELPRFLDTALFIRGDMSTLLEDEYNPGTIYYDSGDHIHRTGISVDFDRNSAQDELRLAFAVIKKDSAQTEEAGGVRILVEFASSDVVDPDNYAQLQINLANGDPDTSNPEAGGVINLLTNRYVVAKATLGDLTKSSGFTWDSVSSVKVYAMVYETTSETPSDKFYVALDGLRFENTTAQNPLYGLSGYTVVKTDDGQAILKEINTSNIIEYRYGMDVA